LIEFKNIKAHQPASSSSFSIAFDESTFRGAREYILWGTKVYIVNDESIYCHTRASRCISICVWKLILGN